MQPFKREEDFIFSSDPASGSRLLSPTGDVFAVNLASPLTVPANAKNTSVALLNAMVWFNNPNVTNGVNSNFTVIDTSTLQQYNVSLPTALYDSETLINEAAQQLQDQGMPEELMSLGIDDARNVFFLTLATNARVDFNVFATAAPVLGFGETLYSPILAHGRVYAPKPPQLNNTNFYLIHCDIVQDGVTVNGNQSQVIGYVPPIARPNHQILYNPAIPPVTSASQLNGSLRETVRCWLTDENNNPVDTLGEYWTFVVRLTYTL